MTQEKYAYKDICLANPQYSEIASRSNLSTEVDFLGQKFKSCAIPANMACSISFDKAEELSEAGYFYILHRFYDYEEIKKWICRNQHLKTISISLGVQNKDYEFIEWLAHYSRKRVDYICIDIAHGHCKAMKDFVEHIRGHFGMFKKNPKIIGGNVITQKALSDLASWGCDSVKCGIAQGAGCSTFNTTSVGCPQFSAVLKCCKPKREDGFYHINDGEKSIIPIIADGGIRQIGDYCKALVAGATMVMAGSEFVKCVDSPAEIVGWENGGIPKTKKYYGSASSTNKGSDNYVEGFENIKLECNNLTYLQYLDKIKQGIQSCMSYHNINDIKDMKKIQWSVIN